MITGCDIAVERAESVDGWMEHESLVWLLENSGPGKTVLEIGSYVGRSSKVLATHRTADCPLYCIDFWYPSKKPNTLMQRFQENLIDELNSSSVRVLWMYSEFALKLLGSAGVKFDLVFIDGWHHHPVIDSDITLSSKLLAPGGIMSGHDYHSDWPEVVEAVDSLVSDRRTVKKCSIWYSETMSQSVGKPL